MAALAALTLIIGVYPTPFLNPIAGYIQGIFAHTPNVLPLPTSVGGGGSSNGGGGGAGSGGPSVVGNSGNIVSANSKNVVIEVAGIHPYKNVMANSQKFGNNVIHNYNYGISNQYEDNNNNNNNYNIGLIKISSALKGALATTK
jgi:hypothetical protein